MNNITDQKIADSFIEELNEITYELGITYDINAIYVNQKDSRIVVEFNYNYESYEEDGVAFTNVIEDSFQEDEVLSNYFDRGVE